MATISTMIIGWVVLSVPAAILAGQFIRFGRTGPRQTTGHTLHSRPRVFVYEAALVRSRPNRRPRFWSG